MTDNRYQQGKIYRIVCNTTGEQYYGSTIEPTVALRLAGHKSTYKRWKNDNTAGYTTSYQIIERDNYEIILVELYPCLSVMELRMRERFFVETNDCINKSLPTKTLAERENHYELNKVRLIEYQTKYIQQNKDKFLSYQKQYYNKNKIRILKNRVIDKVKIKEYHQQYRKENSFKNECRILRNILK